MKKKTELSPTTNRELYFRHLTQLLALLTYEETSFTLKKISNVMNLPIAQIRQYMQALFSIKELSANITFYQNKENDYNDDTEEFTDEDRDSVSRELLSKQLLNGYLDNWTFEMDPETLYLEGKIPFWLSQIEYSQLMAKYPSFFNSTINTLKTKQDISVLSPVIKDYASKIQTAIIYSYEIEFYYNGVLKTGIFPQFLYHDTDRNLIYCIDNTKNYYRLDRIDSNFRRKLVVKSSEKSKKAPLSPEDRQKCDYMWGIADFEEEPVQVCVKIYHDTRNILNKVKDEIRLRKYARIEEHDGFSYYYDTIMGLNSFRSWLRGYGSSLIVLEPPSLAKEMKNSAQKVIELYSDASYAD